MRKFILGYFLLFSTIAMAQVPTPESVLGFKPGADYKMADYAQTSDYFQKVAKASSRVEMMEIGKTSMGRPMWLLIVSSAKNLKKLDQYKEISTKLARARISEKEALRLSKMGKSIVWIDAGMHANERAGAQMVPGLLYELATNNSEEFNKIRDNVIVLLCPNLNPDGQDIMTNWYRKYLGTPYETTSPPVLYQKYVGHDNNRDWFMNNMVETQNVSRVIYTDWYPQIVHNHHQTSPSWARIFLPPFRSPVNQRIHPGVTTAVNLTGTAMANYFAMKEMPGVISGSSYSMWWNGGMRTAPYFHNMVGILTETAHRTPTPRMYPADSLPSRVGGITANGSEIFYPYPWKGGESHFSDAVDYMKNASYGLLNIAADRRQQFLYNIYDMGRDAIEADGEEDKFAYIIPREQWDAGEAINLVHILQRGGIEVHEATQDFELNERTYKQGDLILYGAQSFRPYLSDLLGRQTYPNQYQYPGGPPRPPYDLAGWTLPMQMGVEVIPVDSAFAVTTKALSTFAARDEGEVTEGMYFVLSGKENRSATAINQLLANDVEVTISSAEGEDFSKGDFFIENHEGVKPIVDRLAKDLGVSFTGSDQLPPGKVLSSIKVGLYKSWQPNMDEGWTRWMLEQHGFDLDTLHDADMQKDLSSYDAVIIPSQSSSRILHGYGEGFMPEEFTGGIGLDGSLNLARYVEQGGVLIAFDQSSDFLIEQFGLPVRNVTKNLSSSSFFIPGSIVRVNTDTDHPLGYGMQEETGAFFSRSRAFRSVLKSNKDEGGIEDITPGPVPEIDFVTKYASKDILMSGWAMGENRYLKNNGALVHVPSGEGAYILFGFRPQFRGQPRGTYKLIFNAIYMGATN